MKTKYIYLVIVALFAGTLFSCSDWTDPDAKGFYQEPSGDYYESLRAFKKTDHPVSFGWFGNWTGKGASMVNSLMGLPDSVDFVSIWGNWRDLDQARIEDKRKAKEIKGIRAVMCFIVHDLGDQLTPSGESQKDYWGWEGEFVPDKPYERYVMIDTEVTPNQETIIRKYAKQIIDTIAKYDYDGFDIDYEPNYQNRWGSLANYPKRMSIFIDELSKYLGPKSGSDKLLVIDGEPQSMPAERGECMNYFIVQAYYSSGDADLQSRLQSTIDHFKDYLAPEEVAKKYIVTEDFESGAQNGGWTFTDREGNVMRSAEGMARWSPLIEGKLVPKGGFGLYHMEYDYVNADSYYSEYKWLRKGIGIMNPSYTPLKPIH